MLFLSPTFVQPFLCPLGSCILSQFQQLNHVQSSTGITLFMFGPLKVSSSVGEMETIHLHFLSNNSDSVTKIAHYLLYSTGHSPKTPITS